MTSGDIRDLIETDNEIDRRLRAGEAHTLYETFTLPKASGGHRLIEAPCEGLQRVQHRILHRILYRLAPSPYAHGFVRGRSAVTAAQVHQDPDVVIRIDIADFFTSCLAGDLRTSLEELESAEVTPLIEDILMYCTLDGRLPQGAPTSPALSNIRCIRMDHRLAGVARYLWARYSRYSDDMVFSARHACEGPLRAGKKAWECDRILEKLLHPDLRGMCQGCTMAGHTLSRYIPWFVHVVEEEGFRVNRKKTKVSRRKGRQSVNGLVVNEDHGPRVNKHYRRRTRAMLHRAWQRLQGYDDGRPYASLEHIAGRIAYIHQASPTRARPLWEDLTRLKDYHEPDRPDLSGTGMP